MQDKNKAIIYGSTAVLSWATVATAFKLALQHFSHFEMLLVASWTALLVFAFTLSIQKKWGLIGKLAPREWFKFVLIGLLNPVAYYLVLFKAYSLLPAQVAQPLNYFWPITLLVLLAIFAKQRIPRFKYIGMLLSFAGVILISLSSKGIDGQQLSALGVFLALFSALIWGTYWIINNTNKKTDGTVSLFLSFLFGSFYLLVVALKMGVELHSTPGVLWSMYVGAFEIGIPFLCFSLALRKTNNPALINQMCYLSPFLSLFLIHFILGETILVTTYIGLALIVSGIVFNEVAGKKKLT